MSLVLAYSNGLGACIVSDGATSDGSQILSENYKKFFATAKGLIVASAGFVRHTDKLRRDFEQSELGFEDLVFELENRVAAAYQDTDGAGRPLGIIVIGHDANGFVRIANIGREGADICPRDVPYTSYLCANDGCEDILRKRLSVIELRKGTAREYLKNVVRECAEQSPHCIGGETYEAIVPNESSLLGPQGSLVGNPNASLSYTSTDSSIEWSWSSFDVYLPSGQTVSVSSGSQNFTGLSASTTYYFDFYISVTTAAMTVVKSDQSSGTAPSSVQFLTQTVAADGHYVEVTDLTAATTSGGSGGGSGGGGTCFSGDVKIKTDQGFIRMDCLPSEFTVINQTGSRRAQLIIHEGSTAPMLVMPCGGLVTEEHLFQREDGKWVAARELFKEKAPQTVRTVYNVHVITDDPKDMHYILENGFIAHNKKKLCFSGDTQVRTSEGFRRMDSLPETFRIVNRDGEFKAHLIQHENCHEQMCLLPGGSVTAAHVLRHAGEKSWTEAAIMLPASGEISETLFNVHVEGSDYFQLTGGLEAHHMRN